MIWGNHPFGRPITGLEEEIIALSYNDVKEFYNRYYVPNNAILILAGDIDVATAKNLAQKYFGAVESVLSKNERNVPVLRENFSQRLEMKLPHIQTAKITWEYILPPYAELKGFAYDYDALAQYLGAGQTSALYRDLVLEQKTALSISVDFSFISRSNAIFSISMVPADGISISDAEIALKEAIKNAIINLNLQKVASIKKKMVADLVYIQDNPSDSAQIVGHFLANGFSLEFLQNYENDVEKITLRGIKNAYREVFYNSAKAVGVLLPETGDK